LLAGAIALGCAAPAAFADFTLLDDFQGLNLGNVNGQNGWTASSTSGTVVTDPGDAANQLLSVTTTSANVYKALGAPLSNTSTGTLYYQMKRGDLVNMSTGLSDVAAPTGFGDYESQLNVNSLTINPQPIRMRDAAAFDAVQETFASGVAYHVWHVIDNATDTTKLYIQSATAGSPVLQLNGTQSDFLFRNSTTTTTAANELLTFLVKTGGANATDAAHAGPLFIDNIYFDGAGSNLAVPATLISSVVPEPGTLGVAALGAVGLLARRRRRV
jgi:hypothetical protein